MDQPTNNAARTDATAGPPRKRKRRWLRAVGIVFAVLVVAALVSHGLWGRAAARRLEVQLAAARAAGEPVTVDELNDWSFTRAGSGENIVPALRAAVDSVDRNSRTRESVDRMDVAVPLTDEEVKALTALVGQNREVLAGLDTLDGTWGVDWGKDLTSPLISYEYPKSDFNGMRSLAMLLRADALLAHRAGDHARALRRARQILVISRAVGYRAGLVAYLVSVGTSALGTTVAGEVVPELKVSKSGSGGAPPELVRAVINDLLDDQPQRDGWRRAMVGERVMVVDAVDSLLEGRVAFHDLARSQNESPKIGPVWRYVVRPYFTENAAAMATYDTAALRATLDAPDAPTALANLPRGLLDEVKNSKRYLLAAILTPTLDRAVGVHFRSMAERRLAATALAVKLYEADHDGKPPATLDELVPAYLPAVPHDPFVAGGVSIRYVSARDDPDRPRLYSVDANGADNGGNEPDPNARRRVVEATSDIVRHLKRQPRPSPEQRLFFGYPGRPPSANDEHEEPPATGPATAPTTPTAVEEQAA